jgi:hypothetical protein
VSGSASRFDIVQTIRCRFGTPLNALDYTIDCIEVLCHIWHFCFGNTEHYLGSIVRTTYTSSSMRSIDRMRDLATVRQSIFNTLPLTLSTVLLVWSLNKVDRVCRTVTLFMSSLLKSDGVSFLRTIAQCWSESKRPLTHVSLNDRTEEMSLFIDILIQLNDYTITNLLTDMSDLLRALWTTHEQVRLTTQHPLSDLIH